MSDLQRILAAYTQVISKHGISPAELHVRKMQPGFSGSPVYRVVRLYGVEPSGWEQPLFCLKRVGKSPRGRSADERDRLVFTVAGRCPAIIGPLPTDSSNLSVQQDGFVWQLFRWFGGTVLSTRPSGAECEAAGLAIAEVHEAFANPVLGRADFALEPMGLGEPAGLVERVHQLEAIDRLRSCLLDDRPVFSFLAARLQSQVGPPIKDGSAMVKEAKQQASDLGLLLMRAIECIVSGDRPWQSPNTQLRWMWNQRQEGKLVLSSGFAWRDLHREQMLWQSRDSIGLIDHDFLRWDFLAMDLSRWAQSFESPESVLGETLAGYRKRRPFYDHDQALASTLMLAADWITLANWVRWLVQEERSFPVTAFRIQTRLEPILDRVEREPE